MFPCSIASPMYKNFQFVSLQHPGVWQKVELQFLCDTSFPQTAARVGLKYRSSKVLNHLKSEDQTANMSTQSERWRCAAESALHELGELQTIYMAEITSFRKGEYHGRSNSGSTFDSISRTINTTKWRLNNILDIMGRIHDPPLTCVHGKCHVCHALCSLTNLKNYAHEYESVVQNHRKALAAYNVFSHELVEEYKSFLDIAGADTRYMTWITTFLKKVNVSGKQKGISHVSSKPMHILHVDRHRRELLTLCGASAVLLELVSRDPTYSESRTLGKHPSAQSDRSAKRQRLYSSPKSS